jgi:DNA-binding CsgD family transcriptional regulator
LEKGDRRAVMEALLDLLSRSLSPTVLVIEDTHWADDATLDAIKYLGRRIARTSGLLVLTYRDSEVDYDHPLRQVIGDLPPQNLVRMHLEALSAEAVGSMLGDSGLDLNAVMALTDGNPLFVTEILESGLEKVPLSVHDSVLTRAGKLRQAARGVLDVISVIPGGSEQRLLERILGSTQEELAECARQGLLWVEADTVRFHHELTRRAVEETLSPTDRRRLNKEVLAALDDLGTPSRMAHHAREAEDVESIIKFAPMAAREAIAVGSHREAAAHFRSVEPYSEQMDVAERAALFDDWSRSEFYLDNLEALDILSRGIALHRISGDKLALARALTFAITVNENGGRPDIADECAAEASLILEAFPSSKELAYATSRLAWLSALRSERRSVVEFADRAISLAEAADHELAAISALIAKGYATYAGGDSHGLEFLEQARRRAELGGYAFEETQALSTMAAAFGTQYEVERFVDLTQRARDSAVRYEIPALERRAYAQHAEALQWKGEWAAAEDAANEATVGANMKTMTYAEMVLATLFIRQGRPEAKAMSDRNWARAEVVGEVQVLGPAATARAEYMWLTDEDDPEKVKRFREVLDEATMKGVDVWRSGLLAFWLWKLGELSESPAGIAEPYRQIMQGKAEEAAATFQTKGIPYEQALALMHGDGAARFKALEVFEKLGATPAAAKLRQSMRNEGLVVPRGKARKTREHAAGLTERQAEVLQLLSEDLSNVEIADRLFVSPRTIEHHVSAVMAKLGAANREEAVTRARAEGLLVTTGAITSP